MTAMALRQIVPFSRQSLNHAHMCVAKTEGNGFFFQLQVSEMNEKMSFKVRVKIAASFYMGKNFLDIWHIFICKSTRSELQSV